MTRRKRRRRPSVWKARGGATPDSSAQDRRGFSRRAFVFLALAAVPVAMLALFVVFSLRGAPPARAAIIDELALTDPNPEFVRQATTTLGDAGLRVDYYASKDATVDLYRTLPQRHYRFVIIRSHSYGKRTDKNAQTSANVVGIFTGEPYSRDRRVREQVAGQLDVAILSDAKVLPVSPTERFFGINQDYVRSAMEGRFDGKSVVILMGCDGLSSDGLAQAFVQRGVGTFISWDKEVSAAHTDLTTAALLRRIVSDGQDGETAVAHTMSEVGPDPVFGSRLMVYSRAGSPRGSSPSAR